MKQGHTPLVALVCKGEHANGGEPEPVRCPGSCIRWQCDNEPLFGPQNSPKLIISLSSGNSVEFQVRRASSDVPSPIRLDHGDFMVMDGLAQSENEHRTVSGLQGPRVKLTYRWVTRHTASCPLAGVVGCVLRTCVQGLAEPGPLGRETGESTWTFLWLMVLLLPIRVCFLRGHAWIEQRRGLPQLSVLIPPGVARCVGRRRWRLSRRRRHPKRCSFLGSFGENVGKERGGRRGRANYVLFFLENGF